MKKILMGVILGLLLLVGCGQTVQPLKPVELPAEEEIVVIPAPAEEEVQLPPDREYTLSVIPAFIEPELVPVNGEALIGSTMAYRPAFFEISEVRVGNTVDTWTKDGCFYVGKTRIGYGKDEPMFFLLYNQTGTPTDFSISVENAPNNVNYLRSGSRPNIPLYQVPEEFLDWVTIPRQVTVQPNHAYKVPFGFVVPKLADKYPDNWEFRIRLSDPKNRKGNVVIEYTLRVVIYMR